MPQAASGNRTGVALLDARERLQQIGALKRRMAAVRPSGRAGCAGNEWTAGCGCHHLGEHVRSCRSASLGHRLEVSGDEILQYRKKILLTGGRPVAGRRCGFWFLGTGSGLRGRRRAAFLPAGAADCGKDRIFHQQRIHSLVNGPDLVEHIVVEQLEQNHSHFDV